MNFLILFILISIQSLAFINFTKLDYLSSLILTLILQVITAYVFAITKTFEYYSFFFFALSFISIVFILFRLRKKENQHVLIQHFSFTNLLFGLGLLFILYVNQNRYFYLWDEVYHWGYSAKYLFIHKEIYPNLSGLTGSTYPPATALLSAIFNLLSGTFSEENYYFALAIIPLAIFAKMVSNAQTKLVQTIIFITLIAIPSALFEQYLSSVYVDGILSIVFAYALFLVLFNSFDKIMDFSELGLVLVFLVLIKNTGYQMAFIIIGLWFLKRILESNKQQFNKKDLLGLLILLSLWLTNTSWITFTLKDLGTIENQVSLSILNLETLKNILHLSFPLAYQNEVITKYLSLISSGEYPYFFFNLAYIYWPLLCIALVNLINKKINILFSIFSLGYYGYIAYLLIFYLFYFSSYEASILASADRYLNTYLSALILITIVLVSESIKTQRWLNTVFVLFLVLQSFWLYKLSLNLRTSTIYSQSYKSSFEHMENFKSILSGNDDVMVVAQETSGDYSNYARYLWLPNIVSGHFSFGPKYSSYDEWSVDLSQDEMEATLKNYEYLYLFKVDQQFINHYQHLFDDPNNIKDGQGYKVVLYDNDQHVSLILAYK